MVPPAGTTIRADRLRALNVPQTVNVLCDGDGTPVELLDGRPGGLAARGLVVLETWLVHDEWWRPPGINRRYVEVVLDGGTHMILFEDLNANQWFAQLP